MASALARLLAFSVLFVVLNILLGTVLAGPLAGVSRTSDARVIANGVVLLVSAFGATAIMLRSIDVRPWSDVGLGRAGAALRPILAGWLVGSAAIGLCCALLFAGGWLRIENAADGSWLVAAARVTGVLVVAALAEEVICRGYLLTAARDGLGRWPAVLVTSVIFGMAHAWNPGATPQSMLLVTVAGVFLAAVRVAYDSLYAAWSAHTAWNWVMAVPLHSRVSGIQFESPDYRSVSTGAAWISGGPWGPEGGIFALLGMMAGLGYLYHRDRHRER